MKQKLVLVMGASLALVNLATAQPITQQDVSGNECWNAGQGPGGPTTGFLCLPIVRNGADIRLISGVTTAVTVTQASPGDGTIFWTGTGPTTLIINLTATPFDGEVVTLGTDTTLTTNVTFVAGGTTTMNVAITTGTLTPPAAMAIQFDRATAKWYRIR